MLRTLLVAAHQAYDRRDLLRLLRRADAVQFGIALVNMRERPRRQDGEQADDRGNARRP
jgi:hypothetical protein